MSPAELVFTVKGLLALAGVLLLVWHMDHRWAQMKDNAQRARYLCLLGFGVLLAGASVEQHVDSATLELRNIGATVMAVAFFATALYSARHDRPHVRGRRTQG